MEETSITLTLSMLALGLIAGLVGGLAGIGGGSIMTPVLIAIGVEAHHAVAASLFAIAGTALGGLRRLHREKLVKAKLALPLAASATLGAALGSLVAVRLPEHLMLVCISAVLFASGVVTLREFRIGSLSPRARLAAAIVVMLLGGFVSGLAGKGGGSLAVPTLISLGGLSSREAAATSRLIVLSNAVVADSLYAAHGLLEPGIALPLLAGTYIGSSIASRMLVSMRGARHNVVAASIYFLMSAVALAKLASMLGAAE